MKEQSRRGLLKNAAKAAALATGSVLVAGKALPQTTGKLQKRDAKAKPGDPIPTAPKLYTDVTAYGNLLFVAYKTDHQPGTIEQQTKNMLDLMEKNLIASGSSMQKVLSVHVYLADMADFEKMNVIYRQRDWGPIPPARSTMAVKENVGGPDAKIGIEMTAYI
jgi:2-iminobutanoate/2-iminopropanoate deaminase